MKRRGWMFGVGCGLLCLSGQIWCAHGSLAGIPAYIAAVAWMWWWRELDHKEYVCVISETIEKCRVAALRAFTSEKEEG